MYPITTEQAWANIDRDLRGYFDFSEDDLAANQRGEATPFQIERLTSRLGRLRFNRNRTFVLVALTSIMMLALEPRAWPLLIVLLLPIGLAVAKNGKIQALTQDATQLSVLQVSGSAKRLRILFADRRSYPYDYDAVNIENVTFRITPEQSATLTEGYVYTVYYLPVSKFILSIECDRSNDLSREYVLQEADTSPA